MPDSGQGGLDKSGWIENELSRHLTTVKAPDTLWQRVALGRRSKRVSLRWVLWPAVAGGGLLASSEVRYHAERPTVTRTWVRAAALKNMPERCVQCHTDKL